MRWVTRDNAPSRGAPSASGLPCAFMLSLALLSLLASSPSEPQSVYDLSDESFVEQAKGDLQLIERYATGLRALQGQLKDSKALLSKREKTTFTPEEKQVLLSAWAAMYDYVLSTELIRQRYWDFVKVPPTAQVKHAWGFLLTHGALTTELAHGLSFAELALGHKQMEVLLDEPTPELGLPPRSFAHFKEKVIHVSTSTQLMTGDAYAKTLLPLMKKSGLLQSKSASWLLDEMRLNSKVAKGKLKGQGVTLFAKAGADIVKDSVSHAIFPVQKNVAEWMGDTRVHRKGKPLIARETAIALLPRMQPGDILVARQNWYLSNIGLPGFWPHAALYLGLRDELAGYFDVDPEVKAFAAAQPEKADSFTALLAARFPEKWRAYQGQDFLGEPIRVIESISEGVSFTGITHAMLVDYLGVMRPRLSKLDKARAVLRAFAYQGRPYDFNFDFFSDATLVCTELVYKSYAPGEGATGLKLSLVNIAGRMTLPANELVRLFDQEADRPDRQLDFVAFLDGREDLKGTVDGDAASFRKTYQRVKWDVAQQ
jgi:hypothetical protein